MLKVVLDSSGAENALEELPTAVIAALARKMQQVTLNLQAHVMNDKLEGQVLNRRSGRLRQSIQEVVEVVDTAVTGKVFSSGDVKYARIHEYGGQTPAHDIVPTKAEALSFMIGGKRVFAKIVHHPGSKMPERSFLRSSLADQQAEIIDGLRKAALRGAAQRLGQ